MGCGCGGRGQRRTSRPIGPAVAGNGNVPNAAKLRSLEKPNQDQVLNATGMTKEQRDEERKKRIQAIISKRIQ
jgi:hypothetical protein